MKSVAGAANYLDRSVYNKDINGRSKYRINRK